MSNRLQKHLPSLQLLLTAIVWGMGSIFLQIALDAGFHTGLINILRFTVAALCLLVVGRRYIFPVQKQEILVAALTGLFLILSFYSLTMGLQYTTISKHGFLSASGVIAAPFLNWAYTRKRPAGKVFLCCALAIAGFFILTYEPGGGVSVNIGDVLTVVAALLGAMHVIFTGKFGVTMHTVKFIFLQFCTAAVFSIVLFLLVDIHYQVRDVNWLPGLLAITFLALLSTCLCYFLQTSALKFVDSSKGVVILSTESLWIALFSVLLGYEPFTLQMLFGGLVVFGAVCLLEIHSGPDKSIVQSDMPTP